jgi:hypothetical protein
MAIPHWDAEYKDINIRHVSHWNILEMKTLNWDVSVHSITNFLYLVWKYKDIYGRIFHSCMTFIKRDYTIKEHFVYCWRKELQTSDVLSICSNRFTTWILSYKKCEGEGQRQFYKHSIRFHQWDKFCTLHKALTILFIPEIRHNFHHLPSPSQLPPM